MKHVHTNMTCPSVPTTHSQLPQWRVYGVHLMAFRICRKGGGKSS